MAMLVPKWECRELQEFIFPGKLGLALTELVPAHLGNVRKDIKNAATCAMGEKSGDYGGTH